MASKDNETSKEETIELDDVEVISSTPDDDEYDGTPSVQDEPNVSVSTDGSVRGSVPVASVSVSDGITCTFGGTSSMDPFNQSATLGGYVTCASKKRIQLGDSDFSLLSVFAYAEGTAGLNDPASQQYIVGAEVEVPAETPLLGEGSVSIGTRTRDGDTGIYFGFNKPF